MTNRVGGLAPHGGTARAPRKPNGATTILAGIAALAVGGMVGAMPVQQFIVSGVDTAPTPLLVVLGLYLGGALLLVWGALMIFFRSVAGAILLLLGALVAIAAVVLEPILLYPGMFVEFFQSVFQLDRELGFARIGGVVGGPLVFLLTVLPSTFRYLRYRPSEQGYGVPPGYSSQGW